MYIQFIARYFKTTGAGFHNWEKHHERKYKASAFSFPLDCVCVGKEIYNNESNTIIK